MMDLEEIISCGAAKSSTTTKRMYVGCLWWWLSGRSIPALQFDVLFICLPLWWIPFWWYYLHVVCVSASFSISRYMHHGINYCFSGNYKEYYNDLTVCPFSFCLISSLIMMLTPTFVLLWTSSIPLRTLQFPLLRMSVDILNWPLCRRMVALDSTIEWLWLSLVWLCLLLWHSKISIPSCCPSPRLTTGTFRNYFIHWRIEGIDIRSSLGCL